MEKIIITRTYGGQEGIRVKRGRVFVVGGGEGVTALRAKQLVTQGLAEEYEPSKHASILINDPGEPSPAAEGDAPRPQATTARTAARRRTRVVSESPAEPERLTTESFKGQNGSQTGETVPQSLSQAVLQPEGSTLKRRGERPNAASSESSQSTTDSGSSQTQTSSMPVTPLGGDPTMTNSPEGEAFE